MSRGTARYAAKRDANEDEIVQALRHTGWMVRLLSDEGIPDLLCARGSKVMLLEVKQPGKPMTTAQTKFFYLLDYRAPIWVVETVAEALDRAASL